MATSAIVFFLGLGGLLVLGQLQRIELSPWPAFYLHDLWMLLWASWLSIVNRAKIGLVLKKSFQKKYFFTWLLLIWILIGWLANFLTGDLTIKALFYSARFFIYSLVFFWLWQGKYLKPSLIKFGLLIFGFWMLVWGLGQYLFLPDVRFLSILGWDDHYFRLVGTQFDPNFMGVIFVLLLLLSQTLVVENRAKKIVVALQVLLLLGLALTFSRSAFLSFVVSQVFFWRLQIKKYWPIILLAIFIVLIPKPAGEGVVLTRTASIEARLENSHQSVANLNGWRWLTGRGLFNSAKESYVGDIYIRADHAALPDNLFLLILEGTGLIGLVLTFIVGLQIFLYLSKRYSKANIFVAAVLVHAMFNNSLFQPFVFMVLGLSLISEIDS